MLPRNLGNRFFEEIQKDVSASSLAMSELCSQHNWSALTPVGGSRGKALEYPTIFRYLRPENN